MEEDRDFMKLVLRALSSEYLTPILMRNTIFEDEMNIRYDNKDIKGYLLWQKRYHDRNFNVRRSQRLFAKRKRYIPKRLRKK